MDWQETNGYFIDVDRADYEHLINMLPDGGFMVEVGSFRGRSLASVSHVIKRKKIKVWSVDIFDHVLSEDYDEPDVYSNKDGMLHDFNKTMELFGLTDYVEVNVMTSLEGAEKCRSLNLSPDFVFIDADHSYEAVKKDIEAWWPLVKDNGILGGHDYDHNNRGWPGVYKAVHEKFGQPYFGSFVWSVRKTKEGFNTNTF